MTPATRIFKALRIKAFGLHDFSVSFLDAKFLSRVDRDWIPLRRRFWMVLSLAALGCYLISPAKAESVGGCRAIPIQAEEFKAASAMAVKLKANLEKHDTRVAIVARVGGDISSRGLKYTHAALVWHDPKKRAWRFIHQLNTCGAGGSEIFEQGIINFFLDDPLNYDIIIMHPKPWLQQATAKAIQYGLGRYLHQPKYSMLSYPRSTKYQNSNEWVLEMLTAGELLHAGPGLPTRAAVQRYHQAQGFQGTKVQLTFLENLYGLVFKENVRFNDHPEAARNAAHYEFVSVRALKTYLTQRDLLTHTVEIKGVPKIDIRKSEHADAGHFHDREPSQ